MKQVMQRTARPTSSAVSTATSGHPTLVVLLAQGPDIATTSSQFFDDFSTGLKMDGVTVDPDQDRQHDDRRQPVRLLTGDAARTANRGLALRLE